MNDFKIAYDIGDLVRYRSVRAKTLSEAIGSTMIFLNLEKRHIVGAQIEISEADLACAFDTLRNDDDFKIRV